MIILKPGDPCPCCGRPIPASVSDAGMILLSYIAESMAIKSMLDETRPEAERALEGGKS